MELPADLRKYFSHQFGKDFKKRPTAGKYSKKQERPQSLHKCWKGLMRVTPLRLETSVTSAPSWKQLSWKPPSATTNVLKIDAFRKKGNAVKLNLPQLICCWTNCRRAGSTVGLQDAWLELWDSLLWLPRFLPSTEDITQTQTRKVTHSRSLSN